MCMAMALSARPVKPLRGAAGCTDAGLMACLSQWCCHAASAVHDRSCCRFNINCEKGSAHLVNPLGGVAGCSGCVSFNIKVIGKGGGQAAPPFFPPHRLWCCPGGAPWTWGGIHDEERFICSSSAARPPLLGAALEGHLGRVSGVEAGAALEMNGETHVHCSALWEN